MPIDPDRTTQYKGHPNSAKGLFYSGSNSRKPPAGAGELRFLCDKILIVFPSSFTF